MVYVLMADGFEEAEAIVPVDILCRGGVEASLVGVTGTYAASKRGIEVCTDMPMEEIALFNIEMLVLPGGQPGVDNLWDNAQVRDLVSYTVQQGKYLAAICAAPVIPGRLGLLKDKDAVCFPGLEGELHGARVKPAAVVTDGGIITARSAASAFEFGFAMLTALRGSEASDQVKRDIYYEL